MRKQTKPVNAHTNNRVRKLLLTVAVACAASLQLQATDGAAAASAYGTIHTDGRGTPKLVLPAPAESKVGNTLHGAEQFLKSRHTEFKLPADLSNLELVRARESLAGTHYRFRQVLNGIPVEEAEVVVSVSPEGEVYQACNNSYPVEAPPAATKAGISADQALDAAWNHLRVRGELVYHPSATLVYLPVNGGFRLAYKTRLPVADPVGDWEHHIDAATGEVIRVRDMRITKIKKSLPKFAEYEGPVWPREQTTAAYEKAVAEAVAAKASQRVSKFDGSGRVFDADPRSYLNNGALVDSSAASAFTPAYVTRTLRDITLSGGVYTLTGPYVSIINWDPPATAPSTSASGTWNFSRGNNAFNDTMTYFHIDQNQRYLQALGFTGTKAIQNGRIEADADGESGADNSSYWPASNRLTFGHGGVDDNEDADVILHEYGHAITHDIIPTWGAGDTGAIGEGFGDYWGASYSWTTPNGNVFHPEWAFTWDGHSGDTWPGRFMNMTNVNYDPARSYGAHETVNGIANGSDQLWAAPLWASFTTLVASGNARTNIDKVIIESFFGLSGNPSMRDMAYATVNAANRLFPAGPYGSVFSAKFLAQDILPPAPVPDPVFIVPAGGETFGTGSVVQVSWNRQGAPASAATRLEYSSGAVTNFLDRMESGVNGWVLSRGTGAALSWSQVTTASHSPTHSWFAVNHTAVSDLYLRSPQISITAGAVLSFWHNYNLEAGYDGGVVEISNNGTTWTDLGSAAIQNGYDGTIDTGFSSPIAGRMAFTGGSGGWIETLIPLTAYAGQSVYIRFRLASDSSLGEQGWWVDDVMVYRQWTTIGTAAAGLSTYAWAAPTTPGTNYTLRIQQFATGYSDSAWVVSSKFSLGSAVVPRPTIQSIVASAGSATITWSSVPGATYRVQYKNNINDTSWTSLTPDVVASGATAVKVDSAAATRRFYRVVVP